MTNFPDLVLSYEELSDDELYTALGAALLGSGLAVSPSDQSRFQRFAKAWFDNKFQQLWQRVQETETYRIWASTAGPGQAIEANVLASIFQQQEEDAHTAAALAVVLYRDELEKSAQTYDIAVSFADQQSNYVGLVVAAAKMLGLHVFYERDMTHEWWGRNFIVEGRKVYGQLALHFVPFISAKYLAETRSRDAFDTAMLTAVERGDDYILPVLVGNVHVPPEMLHPQIGYLRAEDHTPQHLATHIRAKVEASKAQGMRARDFGAIVHEAHVGRLSGDEL